MAINDSRKAPKSTATGHLSSLKSFGVFTCETDKPGMVDVQVGLL